MARILSLFDKKLEDIYDLVPLIKEQGFDAIQISPLQKTKDDNSKYWWMLYQPIGFELGNKMGSKKDLEKLCDIARKNDVIIIADAVINHLANKSDVEPLVPHEMCDKDLLNDPNCWKKRKQIYNWDDRYEVINYCMGLPGLNPNNYLVQEKIIKMLNEYADLGVDGFRFDAAKSIALPSEGCNFFPNITYSINRWLPLIYGEVLFSNDELIEKYAKYMRVLTNSDTSNIDAVIRYIENKDSFLSNDLAWSKNIKKEDITKYYEGLASYYPHTLYYARNNEDENEWKSENVKNANKQLVKRR